MPGWILSNSAKLVILFDLQELIIVEFVTDVWRGQITTAFGFPNASGKGTMGGSSSLYFSYSLVS